MATQEHSSKLILGEIYRSRMFEDQSMKSASNRIALDEMLFADLYSRNARYSFEDIRTTCSLFDWRKVENFFEKKKNMIFVLDPRFAEARVKPRANESIIALTLIETRLQISLDKLATNRLRRGTKGTEKREEKINESKKSSNHRAFSMK